MRKTLFAILIASTIGLSGSSVSALSGSDFQAGRIMDDSIFFGTGNIGPNDIQSFLNSKVPVCDTAGTQPYGNTTRAAYGASRGNPAPFICLKDYTQDTPSRGAETGLCNAYAGGTKSAAQIIFDVGQSCGVNPRVLIVLLEKEQSLVTDDWPWNIQYRSATGYGCPDTAPCDAEYYGFFNQAYNAARQFKKYQRDSTLFRYRANRDNYIQYHPNTACGGTNVYIQNQATAGLYNYTPYQPNATALSNIYGGQTDGCSSYGNRNFWRLFNDWFGGVNGGPYEWQLVAQEAYSDPSRTQPLNGFATVQPGQKIYLRVKIRNTGFQPLNSANVLLGTSSPRDRQSTFQDTSWISGSRAARLKETQIKSSEVGSFEFAVQAPAQTGSYQEYFTPVIEGAMWLKDIGLYYHINVVSAVSPYNTQGSGLNSAESLLAGNFILSPDTHSSLTLQKDGNLVLFANLGQTAWYSGSQGQAARLTMQGDGNLVVYSSTNNPLWSTGTYDNPGARLVIQTDGNMVVYSAANIPLWSTGTTHNPDHLRYVVTHVGTGTVFPGQLMETANRKYKLIFQADGNLVLYSPNRATWSSGTWGNPNSRLVMQGDGNLVIYNQSGRAVWHTRSSQHGPSTLVLQQDGNAVLYNSRTQPTWASNTSGLQ